MEPGEECKISVWVCREEKLVSGLSKRTTCADVVKVLLEDQNLQQAGMLCSPVQSYCVVEKWRGFERTLPNKTKILRLWGAWGDEQENVRFVLVKTEASLPNNGPRSAEARVVQSKDNGGSTTTGTPKGAMVISQEKQRRMVRKAFRKLDKINKKREETVVCKEDKSSVEKMETLVHLVISQDHTIRQQVQRVKELDREIERYEAKVHFDRIKRHGVNYVQDTYMMVDSSAETDADKEAPSTAEAMAQLQEYALRCEEVLRLHGELTEREALVESITGEIQEELNHRWMKRRREELSAGGKDTDSLAESVELCLSAGAPVSNVDNFSEENDLVVLEEDRIKTQLDTSLYIGLRLNTDLEAIRGDLDLSRELWDAKERELADLLAKVDSVDLNEELGSLLLLLPEADTGTSVLLTEETELVVPPALEKNGGWVEQARGLSKTCNTNDEDSDTGLSSMHSQDSDNTPVCESLV